MSRGAERLATEGPTLTLPAEDVSYQVVERWFSRCPVRYDTVFLRWDKTRSARIVMPVAVRQVSAHPADSVSAARSGQHVESDVGDCAPDDAQFAELAAAAQAQASGSADWWRQVGAAIRFADGTDRLGGQRAQPAPLESLRRRRSTRQFLPGSARRAVNRHSRRGAPDRARRRVTGSRRTGRSCTSRTSPAHRARS